MAWSSLSCRSGNVRLRSVLLVGTGGCEGEKIDGISTTGSALSSSRKRGVPFRSSGLAGRVGGALCCDMGMDPTLGCAAGGRELSDRADCAIPGLGTGSCGVGGASWLYARLGKLGRLLLAESGRGVVPSPALGLLLVFE